MLVLYVGTLNINNNAKCKEKPYFGKNSLHIMINYTPANELKFSLFKTPFENSLDPRNRWVILANLVPWDELATVLIKSMSKGMGSGSIDLRIVIGALLVKHLENLSDERTIEYIQENIYAQYFVGLPEFKSAPIFASSLFVEIRKRLGVEGSQKFNDLVLDFVKNAGAIKHRKQRSLKESPAKETPSQEQPVKNNRGTLKLDATVAPQYIAYPTDTSLLNSARKTSEQLLDKLWDHNAGFCKPRTYRRVADKKYLGFSKKKKPTTKAIKRCRKEQLGYLRRNIGHINTMLEQQEFKATNWKHSDWRALWIITEILRQQTHMHKTKTRKIADRIVSVTQPHVRPIKRGKSGKRDTEFGCKLNVSETEGFIRVDQASFNNFNESTCLEQQIETYKERYGVYPQLVLVDKIYLTAKNRKFLDSKGIDHAGTPLGRPSKASAKQKRKRKKLQNKRATIEGKFGQAKTRYGLDKIKMKRKDTSLVAINLIALVMNLMRLKKVLFFDLFTLMKSTIIDLKHYFYSIISKSYYNLRPERSQPQFLHSSVLTF